MTSCWPSAGGSAASSRAEATASTRRRSFRGARPDPANSGPPPCWPGGHLFFYQILFKNVEWDTWSKEGGLMRTDQSIFTFLPIALKIWFLLKLRPWWLLVSFVGDSVLSMFQASCHPFVVLLDEDYSYYSYSDSSVIITRVCKVFPLRYVNVIGGLTAQYLW